MRLWHYKLLPYLPDAQFKGQLRELIWVMRQWRDNGTTNHLLINKVMEYEPAELACYFEKYDEAYKKRYGKEIKLETWTEFCKWVGFIIPTNAPIFYGWHNKEYLRVCMANLYEKHHFGIGQSRIMGEEWQTLLEGYKAITGEEYKI